MNLSLRFLRFRSLARHQANFQTRPKRIYDVVPHDLSPNFRRYPYPEEPWEHYPNPWPNPWPYPWRYPRPDARPPIYYIGGNQTHRHVDIDDVSPHSPPLTF